MAKIIMPVPPTAQNFYQSGVLNVDYHVESAWPNGTILKTKTLQWALLLADQGSTSTSAYTYAQFPRNVNIVNGYIAMFKGTKPSLTEVDNMWLTNSFGSKASDEIIRFSDLKAIVDVDNVTNKYTITYSCLHVATAAINGQATWWMLGLTGTAGAEQSPMYVGDISTTSANTGEILMTDTNMLQGQDYTLTPFSIDLPTELIIS